MKCRKEPGEDGAERLALGWQVGGCLQQKLAPKLRAVTVPRLSAEVREFCSSGAVLQGSASRGECWRGAGGSPRPVARSSHNHSDTDSAKTKETLQIKY